MDLYERILGYSKKFLFDIALIQSNSLALNSFSHSGIVKCRLADVKSVGA
jgi:hypothetical protein